MKNYNLKFEKTDSGNLMNDLFYVDYLFLNGLSVYRVTPIIPDELLYDVSCVFFFKDLSSALDFCSLYHVPHSVDFWKHKRHYLMSLDFWKQFTESLSHSQKCWLNMLNGKSVC